MKPVSDHASHLLRSKDWNNKVSKIFLCRISMFKDSEFQNSEHAEHQIELKQCREAKFQLFSSYGLARGLDGWNGWNKESGVQPDCFTRALSSTLKIKIANRVGCPNFERFFSNPI
jgi:hypothetical protein